jgi:hypothetical protein
VEFVGGGKRHFWGRSNKLTAKNKQEVAGIGDCFLTSKIGRAGECFHLPWIYNLSRLGSASGIQHLHFEPLREIIACEPVPTFRILRSCLLALICLTGPVAIASDYLAKSVVLEVYREGQLVFTEEIAKGTKVAKLGQGKRGTVLTHYEGEIFSIPERALVPGTYSRESEFAAGESPKATMYPSEAPPVANRWLIGSKELRNPRVIKEFPASVMVRHEEGVVFVARKDIPEPLPAQGAAHYHEDEITRVRADVPSTTTWLRLRKFMELKSSNPDVDVSKWSVEREIARKERENKDLAEMLNYSYMGLADLVHENSSDSQVQLPELISLENDFADKGIVARQQRKLECGVEVLSTALEYLLKNDNDHTKILSADVANLVRRYPDAGGRVGFALSMGPEIIAKYGIPTSSGTVRKDIRVRGIYKFFIANRDEFPDEKLNSNPLGFQQTAIARFIRNEIAHKRPILAAIWSGNSDKRGNTIGPGFDKHNYPHAVLIVGMSMTGDPANPIRYRILNSWGREWGDDGYGWLYPPKIDKLYSLELL